jgi:hypothetical protein
MVVIVIFPVQALLKGAVVKAVVLIQFLTTAAEKAAHM